MADPLTQLAAASVLAIDGGNSKTDLVLLDAGGEVLARSRSGPFQPHLVGARAAVESFAPAVGEVLAAAGRTGATHVAAYLANADLPVETRAIHDAVTAHGWAASVTVENDTFAVLRAGTGRGFGVAVVCGGGINCVGVAPDGTHLRFPALGRITGDWGGGEGLAEEALWWSVRAEDGRGPATALARRVAAHFGVDTATTAAEQFHLGVLPAVRRHELVTLLFAAAEAGDAVATAVVVRQAEEIVTLVATTVRRLDLGALDVDVVLGGGILVARDRTLIDPLLSRLSDEVPSAHVTFLTEPPVVGAALLGLEQLWGATHAHHGDGLARAQARVRADLGPDPLVLAGPPGGEDER